MVYDSIIKPALINRCKKSFIKPRKEKFSKFTNINVLIFKSCKVITLLASIILHKINQVGLRILLNEIYA